MNYLATITSKRQLTIPADLFRKLNLQEKQKVIVSEEDGSMKITSALALLDKLAGSVKLPKKYKRVPTDEMIERAKREYFRKKYGVR